MKILRIMIMAVAALALFAACVRDGNESPVVEDRQHESPTPTPDVIQEEVEVTPPPRHVTGNDATGASFFPFEFVAEDLFGNVVTHESFVDKELFLLYFWTTWCPACVDSIPGMAEIAEEFYGRVGFVSLLGDFDTGREAAINITEAAGAPFFTVDVTLDYFEVLIPFLAFGFVPITAIIDTQGNQVGQSMVGTDFEQLRLRINSALRN